MSVNLPFNLLTTTSSFTPLGHPGFCLGVCVRCVRAWLADKYWAFSYWESESGLVTEVEEADEDAMDGVDDDDE